MIDRVDLRTGSVDVQVRSRRRRPLAAAAVLVASLTGLTACSDSGQSRTHAQPTEVATTISPEVVHAARLAELKRLAHPEIPDAMPRDTYQRLNKFMIEAAEAGIATTAYDRVYTAKKQVSVKVTEGVPGSPPMSSTSIYGLTDGSYYMNFTYLDADSTGRSAYFLLSPGAYPNSIQYLHSNQINNGQQGNLVPNAHPYDQHSELHQHNLTDVVNTAMTAVLQGQSNSIDAHFIVDYFAEGKS